MKNNSITTGFWFMALALVSCITGRILINRGVNQELTKMKGK